VQRLRQEVGDIYLGRKNSRPGRKLAAAWPVQAPRAIFLEFTSTAFSATAGKEKKFTQIYARFSDMETLVTESRGEKTAHHRQYMAGDIESLPICSRAYRVGDRMARTSRFYGLKRALVELLTFSRLPELCQRAKLYAQDRLLYKKHRTRPGWPNPGLFSKLTSSPDFCCSDSQSYARRGTKTLASLFMRFQQLTAPLMAKGFEDTTFLCHNRLCRSTMSPESRPGSACHRTSFIQSIDTPRPRLHAMIPQATDTKRGEDALGRLNVLSELPEMERSIELWKLNRSNKKTKLK